MSVVGGEMATPDRIKYIQGKMRIAIQNHQVLWERLIFNPADSEVENLLKMLQDIILSLGRRQTELMYQYNRDIRLKYPDDGEMQKKVRMRELGWPDKDEPIKKHVPNGSSADTAKKLTAQLLKRPNMQLVRPGQKMTSLLKPSGNTNQQLQRKESERLKAAAAKQAETAALAKSLAPNQKPKIVLKVDSTSRRLRNEKLSDSDTFPELKESELAGYKLTSQDGATDIAQLSKDLYLELFGLVHKDKRKSMVVSHTKRKRRSAAGQSDFYKDYFQPKRPYNRKTQMTDAESASSSQEITEVDSTEFSPSDKPSVPPSPESSCSTEILEESTPREVSPAMLEEDTSEMEIQEEEGKAGRKALELPSVQDTKGSETAAEESLPAAAQESLDTAAEESLRAAAAQESLVTAAEESLRAAAAAAAAQESSVAAAEDSLPGCAQESLVTASEESVVAASVGVGDSLVDSALQHPTAVAPQVAATPAEESSGEAASSAIESSLGQEAPNPLNKESSADDLAASNREGPSKPGDSCDDKTRLDSATPSPTNEDDDSSLSPSGLIETEYYSIPTVTDPPGDLSSQAAASPPGKQSNRVPVDISAMIGGNVQYVSASDCSEMVNRYLHSDDSDSDSDESDDDDDVEGEDDDEDAVKKENL